MSFFHELKRRNVFKVGVEVAATPLTYLAVDRLKAAEGIDTFDVGISYNPFHLADD
mgnify:CR=1 FL=1